MMCDLILPFRKSSIYSTKLKKYHTDGMPADAAERKSAATNHISQH